MSKSRTKPTQHAGKKTAATRPRRSTEKATGRNERKQHARHNNAGEVGSPTVDRRPTESLSTAGQEDERESLVNDRRRGTKYEITPKVEEVASIHAFMNDLDCKMLDPAVVGEACVESAAALYEQHVRLWLDRDPVLSKAEVRDTGGGLHLILWLEEPIVIAAGEARQWNNIARGICNALPGDPNLNGIIALTRPIGAMNTKYDPPRQVRPLRPGEPITRAEIIDLSRRVAEQPARVWMRIFFGGERVDPCPLCGGEDTSLGVAGYWQCRCYQCGRIDAASLVYRFYSPEFLKNLKEGRHG